MSFALRSNTEASEPGASIVEQRERAWPPRARAYWSVSVGAALAAVLCTGCNVKGDALGGGGCATNAACTSGVCKGSMCEGTNCSCGNTPCSESGTVSTDCAPHWLCIHSFGSPLYDQPATDTCMPECGWCPAGFTCTVSDKTVCDYAPGPTGGVDAGVD